MPVHALTAATVNALGDAVAVPCYERSGLTPSVVHIGVGGFHRAHQAVYFDDLAARGNLEWGVVGVGLHRPEMGEVLSAQNGLFTVVERGPSGQSARVVGSLVDYLFAPRDPEAVLQALADPRTRLVTLTITGGGYLVGEDGSFLVHDRDVQHDIAHPQEPRTAVGYLVEGLRRRREAGTGPFTVLSCDNLPDSGPRARAAAVAYARLRDVRLAEWIEHQVSFPSSMVDRITPQTSPELRDDVERSFGVADRWPVITEPFRQWVVQDDFCAGRPPLDEVGVQFVDDVAPYKLAKARLLNGGHSVLGYVGTLLGHETTAEAMVDPVVRDLLHRVLHEEVAPLLPPVPGMELEEYVDTTLERFANPAIGDCLSRLCRRGSEKIPSFLLPSLREAREQGRTYDLLLLALAAWFRWLRGTDLTGRPVELQDAKAEALQALALAGMDDPRPLLGARSVFGRLGDDRQLVEQLAATLRTLSSRGVAEALAACRPQDHPHAA
jgi:fructuronate reductase/mannitol 2-dehydrogenase